jgi:succinate dehydrogenase flavin-adding protein (antitoxin of CptAB toxin-antitoxin module)
MGLERWGLKSINKVGEGFSGIFAFARKLWEPKGGKWFITGNEGVDRAKVWSIVKKFLIVAGVGSISVLIFVNSKDQNNGLEDLKEANKDVVLVTEYSGDSELNKTNDPFSNSLNMGEYSDYQGNLGTDALLNKTPSKEECTRIYDKIVSGENLTEVERGTWAECDKKNVLGLTNEQRKIIDMLLNDPTLSEEAKRLLREALKYGIDPDSADGKIVKGLLSRNKKLRDIANALAQGKMSPVLENMAYDALDNKLSKKDVDALVNALRGSPLDSDLLAASRKARELGNPEIASLLDKLLRGEKLTPEELAALKAWLKENDPDLYKKLFGDSDLINLKSDLDRARALALAQGRQDIVDILDKLLSGEELTDEEKQKLKDWLRENDPELYKKLFGDDTKYVTKDGRVLTPEELARIQKIKEALKVKDTALKGKEENSDDFFGNKNRITAADKERSIEATGLFSKGGEDDSCSDFVSSMSIVGRLLDGVILSDKSSVTFRIRIKILEEVYSACTNQVVIPKGSIAIAVIGSSAVSFDTGIANFSTTKVTVGNKDITANFTVASGDGTVGMKGKIYDYKAKKWFGTWVTSFAAGMSSAAQEIVNRDIVDEDNLSFASVFPGAAVGGISEVLGKVAEQFGKELEQAPRIYMVPDNIPVVLYPN